MNINATKSNKVGAHELFEKKLGEIQISEDLIPLLEKQLALTFKKNNIDVDKRKKGLKSQVNDIHINKEKLEERFAFGDITKVIYDKYYKIEDDKEVGLLNQLNEPVFDLSNLENFINTALKFCSNLKRVWQLASFSIRKRIHTVVFSDKIYLSSSKDEYLTENINSFFTLTDTLSRECNEKKKGLDNRKIEKSSVVAGTGLEPATFGL